MKGWRTATLFLDRQGAKNAKDAKEKTGGLGVLALINLFLASFAFLATWRSQ